MKRASHGGGVWLVQPPLPAPVERRAFPVERAEEINREPVLFGEAMSTQMPDINEPLTTARDIGEAILALPQKPMDKSLSETLLRLTIAEAAGGFALPSDKPLPPAIKICKSRLAAHGLQASDSVALMIGALCDRPGAVVLYCAAVKAIAEQRGRQTVTLDDFVLAFAMGFPTDDALTTVWDRQKVRDGKGPDNWLDRAEAWEPAAA